MKREIARYICKSESGERYTVVALQSFMDASTLEHPNRLMPGLKELRLLDGAEVNRIDERTFEIVETGEIIRPIDAS